eukprot:CAMPEP_0176491616 /NCGR_PEP_ID=MMETSP0200_2-20121128/8530_1 /TAXON_ID=947934 /ORGANISM="Chaetoceros sp., Strain GSL56" /LENGTH=451 /DNA_ID=CAMNT_0017889063 /DNA_START=620 /DNA_END=1975 /DNA_ORIENTATION=+
MGVTASRDLLCFLKGIYSTASVNSEGLRKLVKKFDKQGPASLSSSLLPELYSSNFHMGLDALDMAIETLRELLDDLDECDNELYDHFKEEKKLNLVHFSRLDRPTQMIMRNESYETEEIIIGKRANEMLWLRDMIRQIPEDDIKHAVAHRGFHNPKGRSDLRPLENSLAAFEAAWTNGIHLCECDVALTKDEKLVLAHDSDFSRLSLDPSSDTSNRKVSELTFKELIALTLKNGVRAPLLLDVLRSAHTIGPEAKLIIEIKPGNNQAAMALARLLARHPEYITHVAVIMSFDLWAMHELRGALGKMLSGEPRRISSSPMLNGDTFDRHSFHLSMGGTIPKLMLLTVAHVPADNYELWVDCNDYSPIDGWLQTDGSCLDGVYVRFEPEMLEPDGAAELKALCKKYTVGVWGVVNKDPDDYETMRYLVKECGVSYFNTDLPRTFLTDSQFEDD